MRFGSMATMTSVPTRQAAAYSNAGSTIRIVATVRVRSLILHRGTSRGLKWLRQGAPRRIPALLPRDSVQSYERRYLQCNDHDMDPEISYRCGRGCSRTGTEGQ
jgi:hypothetical protein